MAKRNKIYTVLAQQIVSRTYQIKAKTEEDALLIAEELWYDSDPNDVGSWDIAEFEIEDEDDDPSKEDLSRVDNS